MFGKTSASQCTSASCGVAGSAPDFFAASFHFLTHFQMSVDIVEELARSSEYVSTKR